MGGHTETAATNVSRRVDGRILSKGGCELCTGCA